MGPSSRRVLLTSSALAMIVSSGCVAGDGGDEPTGAASDATAATNTTGLTQPMSGTSMTGVSETSDPTMTGGQELGGWEKAYKDGGAAISCDQSAADMEGAGAPHLSFGDSTLYVGFEQDGNNQNPVFARFDGGDPVYCERHETEGPDGRAVGLTWNGGPRAYVVYTIVGGGTSLEGKGGWIASYAPGVFSGGGPKVSVIGRVETSSGLLESATFVIAVKSDNKVNSHSPRDAVTVLDSGTVEFLGASAHKPIDADVEAMDCTDYPFDSRYHFTEDLGELVCAECTNCASLTPCG